MIGEPFVGEIRRWHVDEIPPPGWAWCDGRSLAISDHASLFAALGNAYDDGSGAGEMLFTLPLLQATNSPGGVTDRAAMAARQRAGGIPANGPAGSSDETAYIIAIDERVTTSSAGSIQ